MHIHGHSCVYGVVEYLMSEAFDSSVLGLKLPGSGHVQGPGSRLVHCVPASVFGGVTLPASFSQRSAGEVIEIGKLSHIRTNTHSFVCWFVY